MIKRFAIVLLAIFAVFQIQSWAAQSNASSKSSSSPKSSPSSVPALLPPAFSGWELQKPTLKTGTDPAAADPTDYAVLKEYGFADFALATYARDGPQHSDQSRPLC